MGAGSGLRKTVSLPVAAAQEQAEKPFTRCAFATRHIFLFFAVSPRPPRAPERSIGTRRVDPWEKN